MKSDLQLNISEGRNEKNKYVPGYADRAEDPGDEGDVLRRLCLSSPEKRLRLAMY